jgi:hypothetical protein
MSDPSNPQPEVDPLPNPNPQPKVDPPPPPVTPPASPAFDPAAFMGELDTKMTAWTEKAVTAVKEAFPTAPVVEPPRVDPPKDDPPKDDPPKNDPPVPGKKTIYEWWFGGS